MFGIVIVICIFYFDGEKSVLTKKRERERKKMKNLTLWHNAYTYTQDLTQADLV